jgi:hypothetical protein
MTLCTSSPSDSARSTAPLLIGIGRSRSLSSIRASVKWNHHFPQTRQVLVIRPMPLATKFPLSKKGQVRQAFMEHFAKSLIYIDHNWARSPPLNRGLACCSLLESVTPASWVAASRNARPVQAGYTGLVACTLFRMHTLACGRHAMGGPGCR